MIKQVLSKSFFWRLFISGGCFCLASIVLFLLVKIVSLPAGYFSHTGQPSLAASATSTNGFCFAHISDAHVGERDLVTRLTGAINYFNDTVKPAFIIDTGDTVADNTTSVNFTNYTNIIKTSQSWQSGQFYAVPGNHDYIGGLTNFNAFFVDKQVFDYQEYRFIGLDTMRFDSNQLDQQLAQAAAAGKKIILFGHYPVEYTHAEYNLSQAEKGLIKSRMTSYGVLAYLSGHLHYSELAINPSATVLDISAPSLGFTNSYQYICLKDGKISNYPLGIGAPIPQASEGETITATLNQGIDSYLYVYTPQTDYCQADLKVGEKQKKAALFKFDLSSIPLGAVVKSAGFQVYVKGWSGNNSTINAYKIKKNWTCPGVNWGNFNVASDLDRDPTVFSRVTTQGISKWYEFKLTSLVQEWINNPATNKGILLTGGDAYDLNSVVLSSFEALSNKPKLIISYQGSGGFTPTTRPTSTPTPRSTPTPVYSPTPMPTSIPGCMTLNRACWAEKPCCSGLICRDDGIGYRRCLAN